MPFPTNITIPAKGKATLVRLNDQLYWLFLLAPWDCEDCMLKYVDLDIVEFNLYPLTAFDGEGNPLIKTDWQQTVYPHGDLETGEIYFADGSTDLISRLQPGVLPIN